MIKTDTVLSPEAKRYLTDYVNRTRKFMHYASPIKAVFYSNTKHREYLSRFIESVITVLLKESGADPIKAQDKGNWIDKSEVVTDVIGRRKKIGSGEFIVDRKVKKGRADIVCFFHGIQYNLEVKVGRDSQSDDQRQEQARAEKNGERYVIIKTVDDFLDVYDEGWRASQ